MLKKYRRILIISVTLILAAVLGALPVCAETDGGNADFVLLLDCTDSMSKTGTAELCESAAKLFSDLIPSNDARIAVAAFGNTWTSAYMFESDELSEMNDVMGSYARTRVCLSFGLSELDGADLRTDVRQSVHDRVSEGRFTHTNAYIGGGLMTALDRLCSAGSEDAAIILVSDGRLSGFDTTDGVEWKRTNSELVSDAAELASSKGWRIYTLELNSDGRNTSMSPARQLLSDLASDTGGLRRELTEADFNQLVSGFVDIFADFMNAEAGYSEKTLSGGSCTFELKIPEVTSETNLVITGDVESVEVGGRVYSSDAHSGEAYFVRDEYGNYTLLKLFSPDAGTLRVTVKGSSGSTVGIYTVNTRDLPVGLSFDSGSPMIRNKTLGIDLFLADPGTGEPIPASDFYSSCEALITVSDGSEESPRRIEPETSESGFHADVSFPDPGSYEISVKLVSDVLRGGEKTLTRYFTVENYGMETRLEGISEGDSLAKEQIVTIHSFFTGPDGGISDSTLYSDGDAELTVSRDGSVIASGLAMTAGEDGYRLDYALDSAGEYSFSVRSRAECFGGNPASMLAGSGSYVCGDYSVEAEWSVEKRTGGSGSIEPGDSLSKGDIVRVTARLVSPDGRIIEKSRLLCDGAARLAIKRGDETVGSVPAVLGADGSSLTAEWKIVRAGELAASISLESNPSAARERLFGAVNQAPELLKDSFEAECSVGESVRIPLSEYVLDPDEDSFEVSAVGSEISSEPGENGFSWRLSEDGENIILDAGVRAAGVELTFDISDGDESVRLPVSLGITNRRPVQTDDIELPHFVLGAPAFMFFVKYDDHPVSYELDRYFSDPEGLELSYSLESPTEMARLSGHTLEIDPSGVCSERLKLTVTDSSGETIAINLRLTADNWWTLNLRRVLIAAAIALAVIVLIAIIIRRESNIGYLRILSASIGGEPLETIEKLNKRRIRFYSLDTAKFLRNRLNGGGEIAQLGVETGKITGHLIFGSSVKLCGLCADRAELRDREFAGKLPKKLKLKAGEKLTLCYGELRIIIENNN